MKTIKQKMMVTVLFCLYLLYSPVKAQQVSFYVQAHEDDWQLFMSKNAIEDIGYAKVVFITLTAGDAGNGQGGSGTIPFYSAREKGSVYSSKFASDFQDTNNIMGPIGAVPISQKVLINKHPITKYSYRNIVNYFFRLPDGNMDGSGFPLTGNVSLMKLRKGLISSITAVDSSTTYNGWGDLTQVILQIIMSEKLSNSQVWVNSASVDDSIYNPGDHSDHYYSSYAVRDAVVNSLWIGINGFMDYNSSNQNPNLFPFQVENASALFAFCQLGFLENLYYNDFHYGWKKWLPMDYNKIDHSPKGSAKK